MLAQNSWDLTHKRMRDLIESRILSRELRSSAHDRGLSSADPAGLADAVLGD